MIKVDFAKHLEITAKGALTILGIFILTAVACVAILGAYTMIKDLKTAEDLILPVGIVVACYVVGVIRIHRGGK